MIVLAYYKVLVKVQVVRAQRTPNYKWSKVVQVIQVVQVVQAVQVVQVVHVVQVVRLPVWSRCMVLHYLELSCTILHYLEQS